MKEKRFLATITTAVLTAAITFGVLPMQSSAADDTYAGYLGDINRDTEITVSDLVLLNQYLLVDGTLTAEQGIFADLDESQSLNAIDAAYLKQILLGLREAVYIDGNSGSSDLIAAPILQLNRTTQSIGEVKALLFEVEFADATFADNAWSAAQIETQLFSEADTTSPYYPTESVAAYYARASYGNLSIDGDVFSYTATGTAASYEAADDGFETLMMEILTAFDAQLDYNDYDQDGDGVIDALSINVPVGDGIATDADFWYGCMATWYANWNFAVDNCKVNGYIINDEQPTDATMTFFIRTLCHELGHSMGLPDYYKYNSSDWEGLHGDAGYCRMDDSCGDFCGFSKLMLGWFTEDAVQVADLTQDSETYHITSMSDTGSCLIVPIQTLDENYFSEYFIVEYLTPTNNYDGFFFDGGIRIMHVQAEIGDSLYGGTTWKYENYGPNYQSDDNGIRVLRLVNDGNGFYTTGDVASYGTSNFAAYDADEQQTINPGYSIEIGALTDGQYAITVTKTE